MKKKKKPQNKLRPHDRVTKDIFMFGKEPTYCQTCKYYENKYWRKPCINCHRNIHLRSHYKEKCKDLFVDFRQEIK